jgi:hypothetical protein
MTQRRQWWAQQCGHMASLAYAGGYKPLGDEHYAQLVRTLVDDKHKVVWSGDRPTRTLKRRFYWG